MRQRARLRELAFGGGTREVVGGGEAGGMEGWGGGEIKMPSLRLCLPAIVSHCTNKHPILRFYEGEFAESQRFLFSTRLLGELRQNCQRRFKSVFFLRPCVQLVPLRFQVYKRQASLGSVFRRPQKSGSKQSCLLRGARATQEVTAASSP